MDGRIGDGGKIEEYRRNATIRSASIIFWGLFSAMLFACPEAVWAWGPGVHTVTALSLLDNLAAILPPIAHTVSSFPREYVYGCLTADYFIGKGSRKKAEHPHNWAGGFGCLQEANDERERAYAYGFLSHLAADVIAHNLYVPNMMSWYATSGRMGHLFWEIRADYLVGPKFTRIAREVLHMEHPECDDLIDLIAGKGRNGLRAKKRLFTQSVNLSDYFYSKHSTLVAKRNRRWRTTHAHTVFMVDLACRMVQDLLTRPGSSICLEQDPLGRRSLQFSRGKRFWKRRLPEGSSMGAFRFRRLRRMS
jgi:hypothetical protein